MTTELHKKMSEPQNIHLREKTNDSKKIKVIYIMGSGRSGSTILGIVLDNIKNIFYTGEIHFWNQDKGVPTDRKEAFEFWDRVKAGIPERDEFFSLDFDSTLEYHAAFSSIFFRSANSTLVKKFHEQTQKLFASILRESNDEIIVDSSHYAVRAYWINKNPALDVNYIYLYRDPVDVMMGSFRKKDVEQPYKNFITGSAILIGISLLSNFVYLLLPRKKKMKLRYEDFIKKPQETLNLIGKNFNIEMQNLDFKNLDTGLLFRANRIRLLDKIALENKLKRPQVNPFMKAVIYLMNFPFILLNPKRYK